MKTKRIAMFSVGVAVLAGMAIAGRWWLSEQLPHFALRDGGEFRVLKVTYTRGPSRSMEHSLNAPWFRWFLWNRLPDSLKRSVPAPPLGIGSYGSDHPLLSIWWARIDPVTHEAMLGPSGDVWVTVDSGKRVNLGYPDPVDEYRLIFVNDPPTDSKRLIFDVPVEEEAVHFEIENPAYRK